MSKQTKLSRASSWAVWIAEESNLSPSERADAHEALTSIIANNILLLSWLEEAVYVLEHPGEKRPFPLLNGATKAIQLAERLGFELRPTEAPKEQA
jgi:hypothetical protein